MPQIRALSLSTQPSHRYCRLEDGIGRTTVLFQGDHTLRLGMFRTRAFVVRGKRERGGGARDFTGERDLPVRDEDGPVEFNLPSSNFHLLLTRACHT